MEINTEGKERDGRTKEEVNSWNGE